jgi:RNA polymerase sigma-70 factor (ECF subfamily)
MTGSDHDGGRLSEFLRLHQPGLRAVAMRFSRRGAEAEDLVQDTLERALLHFAELSPLPREAQRAWLVRTLSRRFIDICRHRGKEVVGLPRTEEVEVALLRETAEDGRSWEQVTAEQLRHAVSQLPEFLAEPFRLRSAGQSYKAIAEALGASQGTVGSWLSQARHRLRELLGPALAKSEASR